MKSEKFFRVYADADVLTGLPKFDKEGNDCLVDSTQDDDVESDDDVVQSGIHTSFRDLLVVKDYMKLPPEKVRTSLRTYKLWAPLFGGRLPYLHENKGAISGDRSRSHMTNYRNQVSKYQ